MTRIATLGAVGLGLMAGCWTPQSPTSAEFERGLVWMLPGINGRPYFKDAYRGLRDGGVDAAIEVYDWHGSTPLENLQSEEANFQAAREIAVHISDYAQHYPGRPIDLVGYSGGGGLAPMIAAALPRTVYLRNVILVQPALSPGYDLTPCAQRVDGQIVNLYCSSDRLILGAGTVVFGTIDRKFVASAGQVGFDINTALPDPELRERFTQRKWSFDMLSTGHIGGHMGIAFYKWNREVVAPLLSAAIPPQEVSQIAIP